MNNIREEIIREFHRITKPLIVGRSGETEYTLGALVINAPHNSKLLPVLESLQGQCYQSEPPLEGLRLAVHSDRLLIIIRRETAAHRTVKGIYSLYAALDQLSISRKYLGKIPDDAFQQIKSYADGAKHTFFSYIITLLLDNFFTNAENHEC